MQKEKVEFLTNDQVTIVGEWYSAGDGSKKVLLLHMMPTNKESWAAFQDKLSESGISSLAIDFRGHGESVKGERGNLDYKNFTDLEHQAKIRDVLAAVKWLKVGGDDLAIVGASIGANLACQWGAEHPDTRAIAALSPGLNYRGVLAMPLVRALTRSQFLFLAASDDDRESFNAAQKLNETSLAKTKLKLMRNAGHGTEMFNREPSLMEELASWLLAAFKE
jgi:alpha-beta hydrolase superfamily lysophospholipase